MFSVVSFKVSAGSLWAVLNLAVSIGPSLSKNSHVVKGQASAKFSSINLDLSLGLGEIFHC